MYNTPKVEFSTRNCIYIVANKLRDRGWTNCWISLVYHKFYQFFSTCWHGIKQNLIEKMFFLFMWGGLVYKVCPGLFRNTLYLAETFWINDTKFIAIHMTTYVYKEIWFGIHKIENVICHHNFEIFGVEW